MSLFCLCAVEGIREKSENAFYTQQLEILARQHGRGIKFFVDWPEPIISCIQKDSLVISILDCSESDNCEFFLLPDGWYSNGQTAKLTFKERMEFLQDISNIFINRKYSVDLYMGQSGTRPEEFSDVILKNNVLVNYLINTVGVSGIDDGVHIRVIP